MYTKEFIEEVKRVYPDSKEMIRLAEAGDMFLGRYLDDARESGCISAEFILTHSYDEIIDAAKRENAKNRLYSKWFSGSCYVGGADRENYCPANHMQNSSDPDGYDFSKVICQGAKYTGYYPACERYGCKELCWKKYDELKKKKEESVE